MQSRTGYGYIMIMVEIDSNYVLLQPMKNKSNEEMVDAYEALIKRLRRAGIIPEKHVLGNECSENLKELIRDTYTLEFVSPRCRQRNIAEVAIKAFKQHFLSILAGLPDGFPWSLWGRLLPQTEVTLNLLCQANATSTVSAYAHMYGNFDCNRMPLAPVGCPCQVHGKHDNCKSWDFYSQKGYYLFTSGEQYRTDNIFMKDTRAEQLSDTVVFQHSTVPIISHADRIINVMTALSNLTIGMIPKGAKKAKINMHDIKCLAEVTKRITAQQPDIAGLPSQNELRNAISTQNPLSATKAPPIEHMQQSPRLLKLSTDTERMQKLHQGVKAIKERIKAYQEANKMKQPEPRVSVTTPPHGVKVIKERIKAYQEEKGMKQLEPRVSVTTLHISVPRVQTSEHTEPRVTALEQAVPKESFAKTYPQVKAALKRLQETLTTPTPPMKTTLIATRTQAAQTSAKLKAAAYNVANLGPAGNTRSKSSNTLERAMYAACFIYNKNEDAQRLVSRRYPMAMFAAALAVLDMESGDMMKY